MALICEWLSGSVNFPCRLLVSLSLGISPTDCAFFSSFFVLSLASFALDGAVFHLISSLITTIISLFAHFFFSLGYRCRCCYDIQWRYGHFYRTLSTAQCRAQKRKCINDKSTETRYTKLSTRFRCMRTERASKREIEVAKPMKGKPKQENELEKLAGARARDLTARAKSSLLSYYVAYFRWLVALLTLLLLLLFSFARSFRVAFKLAIAAVAAAVNVQGKSIVALNMNWVVLIHTCITQSVSI